MPQLPKTAKLLKFEASKAKNKAKVALNMPPKRKPNIAARTREYLTSHEISTLRKAAKSLGRNGYRDDLLILMLFRHALRVSEIIALRWEQVDLKLGLLHVKRIKNGMPATHPLGSMELRGLRQLQRETYESRYIFISERKAPLTARTVRHIVARAAQTANLSFTVHPHMLRHSTGFYLANKGHDTRAIQSYMGHSNIKNTVIYTELSPKRFNGFWND